MPAPLAAPPGRGRRAIRDGIVRIFDLGSTLAPPITLGGPAMDAAALRHDWAVLGQDLAGILAARPPGPGPVRPMPAGRARRRRRRHASRC